MKSELATPSSGLLRYAYCSSVGTAEQALPSRQCQLCRLLTCIYLQRSLARRKCARCGERRQRKGVVRYPDDSLKFAGLGVISFAAMLLMTALRLVENDSSNSAPAASSGRRGFSGAVSEIAPWPIV